MALFRCGTGEARELYGSLCVRENAGNIVNFGYLGSDNANGGIITANNDYCTASGGVITFKVKTRVTAVNFSTTPSPTVTDYNVNDTLTTPTSGTPSMIYTFEKL